MHPEWDFFIYNTEIFINHSQNISGSLSDTYKGVPPGYLSLYEYNINRSGSYIKPFLEANSSYKTRFRKDLFSMLGETKDGTVWNFGENEQIQSDYRMSASITREYLELETHNRDNGPDQFGVHSISHNHTASAIKNACLGYRTTNPSFSNSLVSSSTQTPLEKLFDNPVNMINIPSIFYGSAIKKGSVELNYYLTGTLISTVKDENENGQLICTFGTVSSSIVGHVLYDHGIIFFPSASATTASLDSSGLGIKYSGSTAQSSSWLWFGAGANDGWTGTNKSSASFGINFEGTTYKNTMTMFCHADKGELNYSNNPTFLNINQSSSITGYNASKASYEDFSTDLKNIASSSFHKGEDEFRKVTYISKVGIYDEDNNLLMTVDLARPYKKEEKDNFTFKIKYDLL